MSNPQKENGFSGISNELLTEIYKRKFNGSQFSIILSIIRWTYGFQRKFHSMSDSFISKDTLMTAKLVNRELGNLIKANVITVYKPGTYTTSREIGLNKNYDTWTIERRSNEKSTPQSEGTSQSVGSIESVGSTQIKSTPQLVETSTPQLVDRVPHNQGDKKEILNKNIKKIFSSDSNEYRLADYLRKYILKNNPSAKVPDEKQIQNWCKVFDLMLRIDKRTVEDIKEHIYFSQIDSFWMGNILSPTSLRKQYDKLTLKMKGSVNNEPGINYKSNTKTGESKWGDIAKRLTQSSEPIEDQDCSGLL